MIISIPDINKNEYFLTHVIRIMYLYLSTYSRFCASIGFTVHVFNLSLSMTMTILCDDDDDVVKTECFDQTHRGHGAIDVEN